MAVISRFLWGFLNGNIGVSKTYMGEITDDSNNARGMALFAVVGGIGRTIGPMIGGFLSEPAKSYPNIFGNTIFELFPYALPNLLISINCIIVVIIAYFELPETLRLKRSLNIEYSKIMASDDDDDDDLKTLKDNSNLNNDNEIENNNNNNIFGMRKRDTNNEIEKVEIEMNTIDDSPADKRRVSFASLVMVRVIGSNSLAYGQLKKIKPDEEPSFENDNEYNYESDDEESKSLTSDYDNNNNSNNNNNNISNISNYNNEFKKSEIQFKQLGHKLRFTNGSEYNDSMEVYLQSTWTQIKYLLSKKEIFLCCLLYGTNAFVQLTTTEIFPLWVVTSKIDGGFSFDTNKIGMATSITGPITIILQLLLYPMLVERYGVFYTYRLGCILFAITMITAPCISIFNKFSNPAFMWISVVVVLTAISTSATFSLISIFVLINNSCYSHERGTVNGIGQTFAAMGRLLGPYFGSVIFAWSETNGYFWPLNYFFIWYIMGIVAICNYIISKFLPKNLQRRKREPKEARYALYHHQKETG